MYTCCWHSEKFLAVLSTVKGIAVAIVSYCQIKVIDPTGIIIPGTPEQNTNTMYVTERADEPWFWNYIFTSI